MDFETRSAGAKAVAGVHIKCVIDPSHGHFAVVLSRGNSSRISVEGQTTAPWESRSSLGDKTDHVVKEESEFKLQAHLSDVQQTHWDTAPLRPP
jgi:hypothetical protein